MVSRSLKLSILSVDQREMRRRRRQLQADRALLDRIDRHHEAMIALARAARMTVPTHVAA